MALNQSLEFHLIELGQEISDFVYCFSSLTNSSVIDKELLFLTEN